MPYGLRGADGATLEVFGAKLRVKDEGLDASKIRAAKVYTDPSDGFTIEHENKAIVEIIFTGPWLQVATDATTAIADGSVVGQKLRIVIIATAGVLAMAQLTIKDDANTKLLGDLVIVFTTESAIPAWVDFVWDGTDWLKNNSNDGTPIDVSGINAHGEGEGTTASGDYSHAEGQDTTASGDYSHAEGKGTTASGDQAHAEGWEGTASGDHSHVEGKQGTATDTDAHAEGFSCDATGTQSHAEGYRCNATGNQSHAQGADCAASGSVSHAMGQESIASLSCQFAQANGSRAAFGDSQFTRFLTKKTTTTADAAQEITVSRFTLDDDKVYACRINIAATKSDLTEVAWFNRMVLVSRGEGANDVTKVAEYTIQDIGSNSGAPPAGWAVTFTADDANDALKIAVETGAAITVYWVVVIECVEVA